MQTSHERRGGYGGGGGKEESRERGNLLLISAFPSSGAGAAGTAAMPGGARRVARRWWLRASLRDILAPKLKPPHTPSGATDTPALPAGPRGLAPRCSPGEPRCLAPGASRGAFHADFCGKRMPARRGRRRTEGPGLGGSSWRGGGEREKSAALRQGRGHGWLPRPTETICLLQMVWKVIKVGARMKIIDNV